MRWVSSVSQGRNLDRQLANELGIPGVALMEIASKGVAEYVRTHLVSEAQGGVLVVCGAGNNGGDGYGVARWLAAWGFPVCVWSLSDESRTPESVRFRLAAKQMAIAEVFEPVACGLIIDAILGTGLSRPVDEATRRVIEALNQHSAPILAVDVPSGLNANTGQPLGASINAELTVTLGRLKPAFFLAPGTELCGRVHRVDIGIDAVDPTHEHTVAQVPSPSDLQPRWPTRLTEDHKHRSGHLCVIAGSTAMAGAAVLTCLGALRAGVGLVTLMAPRGAMTRLSALPPEVMWRVQGDGDRFVPPTQALDGFTAIAVGPGLGGGHALSPALLGWLQELWNTERRPMVFDADALVATTGDATGPRVITPHLGEARRLLQRPTAELAADRFQTVGDLCQTNVVALLKGRHTLIAAKGEPLSINTSGNAILATAGSGDVLTGVIGALLARGVEIRDAAILGAHVHGVAADRLATQGIEGWTASDVSAQIRPPLDGHR